MVDYARDLKTELTLSIMDGKFLSPAHIYLFKTSFVGAGGKADGTRMTCPLMVLLLKRGLCHNARVRNRCEIKLLFIRTVMICTAPLMIVLLHQVARVRD